MKNKIGDRFTAYQMLLDDSIHVGISNIVIPNPIRLYTHDWPPFAGSKAGNTSTLYTQRPLIQTCSLELFTKAIKHGL
ncbi:hypothetical protein GALL_293200 [mine drainage metagenome]|uniref:Uncharacterized protein n=1 Tax=mine drainage metagenome TaxID=410659 RepID=A0A1J5R9L0_9ZZZZ